MQNKKTNFRMQQDVGISRMNYPCVAVFLQIDFEKTSIEEKKYVTQHPTVFLLFKQQLLFMVIKKTGK